MRDDDGLLQADRRARLDALDVARSFIVQAPAGSGKTELLIQRYLKLLAEVDNPEEVVAITFTRKAAQEMQLRAVAAIRDAQQGIITEEAHYQVTLDAARKVLQRDRANEWRLLDSPRRMRIQTLDALNAGIAGSLPFSSGMGNAGRIVTDDEMQSLYRSAAKATFDWLLTDGPANDAVEQVLSHLDNNTSRYIAYIAAMLATRDQWMPIVGTGAGAGVDAALGQDGAAAGVRAALERNIAKQVSARLRQVRRLLPDESLPLLASLCRYAGGNLTPEAKPAAVLLADCKAFPPAAASHVGIWRAIAALLLTQAGGWRKTVNKNDGFPLRDEGQKQQMLELLRMLGERAELAAELHRVRQLPDPFYTDDQWAVLLALFRLLPVAVGELRRLFSEQGVADHTEVALAAADALGTVDDPGEIGLLLDFTIRHLLIDEMQDTSLAQYGLIEQLVAGWEPGDGRTLFCVGDPMQSIYRFRNAEVGQFLLAREQGIGPVRLEPLLLRQNFRSGEHLVHWFNTVFEQILPRKNDIAAGAIAYSASVPVAARRGSGECHVHPLFDVTYEEEAEYAAGVIRRCVNDFPDQSTVVLVRSRTRLPLLLARLRQDGVAYQAVEIDRLTDLPEIIDVLALTRAIAHRGDRVAWLALLRGPCVGLDWTDLHRLVLNDSRCTVWELLHDQERIAGLTQEGREAVMAFRETLAPVIAAHGARSLRDTVEQAWYRLRGPLLLRNEEEVENVYRFFDVLSAIDTAGTLHDVAELEMRLDQERVSGRATADCRLHIMTVHKAKGLQFDNVVVYGLGRTAKGDQKALLSWLNLPDKEGRSSMLISPVGPGAELQTDPLHNFIETTERAKGRLEQDRLLYVACTRARHSVHLIGHVALTAEGDAFREPRDGTLLQRLWPTISARYAEAFQLRTPPAGDAADTPSGSGPFVLPERRRLKAGAGPLMPAELPDRRPAEPPQAGDDQQVEFYWVGATGRLAGTILHRWLHRLATGRLQVDADNLDGLLPVCRNWAKELGVPNGDLDAVAARALLALRNILEDERGSWILSGPGHAEFPVTGIWMERIESIVIDRIRVDDAGNHWIIDYKASTHEGSDLAGFLHQEADRYRQQLTRYVTLYGNLIADPSVRIRAALYFPLLQKFVEVRID